MSQSVNGPGVIPKDKENKNKEDVRGRPLNCGVDVMHQKGLAHGQGFYQSKLLEAQTHTSCGKATQQKSCGIGLFPCRHTV